MIKGDLFGIDEEEIIRLLKEDPHHIPNEDIGEFLFIHYDNKKKTITITTDRFGRETCYYYFEKNQLIITDDFWQIIKNIKVTEKDINTQAIKEALMLFLPLNDETFVKGVFTVSAGSQTTINIATGEKTIHSYWSYRLKTNKNKGKKEKLDRLHEAFIKTAKDIAGNHSKRAIYGIGISGGLDSRIAAHYAMEAGMHLQSFIIGQARPHLILKSRDHKNAQQICRALDIPHKEVPFDSEPYEKKLRKDIEKYPAGSSEIFKYVHRELPHFNVLLTGVGDMYVGSKIPNKIEEMNKEQLAKKILIMRGMLKKPVSPLKRLMSILGIGKQKQTIRSKIPGIITKEEVGLAKERLITFLSRGQKRTNFERYQDYVIAIQGSKNKMGAFESILGEKETYSIYNHLVFNEALTWTEEELVNRKLLKDFVKERLPHLAEIKLQNWQPALGRNFGFNLESAASLFSFIIRGWGVMRYPQWSYTRKFKRFAKKEFRKKSPWFDHLFDNEAIWKSYREKTIDCRMFLLLLKMRRLLETIRKSQQ